MQIVVLGGLVALALLSLGSLLSIFVAGVLALGLDPVVSSLVRHGWKRGPAALAVIAGLFAAVFLIIVITVGPLWGEVRSFIDMVPQYWTELTNSDVFQKVVSSS